MAFHKARALQEAEKSVAQGKTTQAIKQYQDILDNDPSDVSLLNTIGDLYIRDRNITEGLRQFHRLAEAYVREGFNVKAIAIYRKISKVDPNSIEIPLKLADLYQLQGLSREAREQYLQAAEFFKKRNQKERVLEVLRKLVQLDPENLNFRGRLAAECEQAGKRGEAGLAYLELAEIVLRRDDQAAAETALKKAAELDPKNSKIQILRARVALARDQPEEAERIINSSQELQSDIAGRRILLDAYTRSRKLPEAEELVLEVFRANPSDFAPVSTVSALLVESGNIDEAYKLLAGMAEPLISQNNAAPLLEALRRIWDKAPDHIPTMELIHHVCEKTADELTLPEVLQALGRAHEQAGDLEKAEAAYLKLTEREPENEHYRGLLNAVQQKLGREIKPVDFATHVMALSVEEELPPEPVAIDARQEQMVKEALENSDLFSRYNLTEKAIVELEKVLQIYPDQVEIHRRILEISRKGFPERGAVAAAHLARIFAAYGDAETANKYQAIASAKGVMLEIPLPPPSAIEKVEEPAPPPSVPPERPEAETPTEFPISAITAEETAGGAPPAPLPVETPFDISRPEAPGIPPIVSIPPVAPEEAGQTLELDLSRDLEAMAKFGYETPTPFAPEQAAPPPVEIPAFPQEVAPPQVAEKVIPGLETSTQVPEPPPASSEERTRFNLDDSRIEVEFYLENSFFDEARQAVAALEEKCPGSPLVAELRQRLDEQTHAASTGEPFEPVAPTDGALKPEPPGPVVQTKPTLVPPPAPAPLEDEPALEEWELPTNYAVPSQPPPATGSAVPPPAMKPEAPLAAAAPPPSGREPAVKEPATAKGGGMEMLGGLTEDLASTLDKVAGPAASPAVQGAPPPDPSQGVAQLSGLLAEMEEPGSASAPKDDPETHYNLGVAFREMGLLDESIGEFQKVVRGSGKGNYPQNFLQACSLLAICFMEKKMPAIAVKWYKRALETPDLDEEAQMALEYDLGVAYEQAGDSRNALARYTEVYSQNIDFRDVADKIRELQQKA